MKNQSFENMADPKYANLYGIAYDQPDVYETSDLPEAEQAENFFEEKCDSVELVQMNVTDAHKKFKGKELDGDKVDFSDRVGNTRLAGYTVRSNTYETVGLDEAETVWQKYDRLKKETEQLLEEVSTDLTKSVDVGAASDRLDVTRSSVNDLLQKLTKVELKERIGADLPPPSESVESPELRYEKLMARLNNVWEEKKDGSEVGQKPPELNKLNSIEYVFNRQLQHDQQSTESSLLADIERRITKLENLAGSHHPHMARLSNIGLNEGLIGCCQRMMDKVSLLDTNHLDMIESRMSSVVAKMEKILANQNSLNEDPEREKMNDLYEICNEARTNGKSMPQILDRMAALESIHKQGKECVQTVARLEMMESDLEEELAATKRTVHELRQMLADKTHDVTRAVDALAQRLDVVDDKIPK